MDIANYQIIPIVRALEDKASSVPQQTEITAPLYVLDYAACSCALRVRHNRWF